MRKAERLFQLLTILRSRRQVVTAQFLAEQLQVSERTVYRDMQALSLSGIPIESEAGVGYRLKPGFSVPPLMFDEAELEALWLGVRMVQGWSDTALAEAADSALEKIRAVLPDHLHRRHTDQGEWLLVPDFHRERCSRFGDIVRAAIKAKQMLEIHYTREDGQNSSRSIRPLGLIYWGRTWCVVGWCELRDAYRQFRLDRIETLEMLERHFETSDECSLKHYLDNYCE